MITLVIVLLLTLALRKSFPVLWVGALMLVSLCLLQPIPPLITILSDPLSIWLILLSLYILLIIHQPPTPHSRGLWYLLVTLTFALCLLFLVDRVLVFYLLFEATLIPIGLIILG